jgi:hypothetical protein
MKKAIKFMVITTLIMLFISVLGFLLFHLPYNYYQLLRWIVFATCILIISYKKNKEMQSIVLIIFIILGILYNPISPLYFAHGTWFLIDWFSIILIFFGYVVGFDEE